MAIIGHPAPDLARRIELSWFAAGTAGAGRAFYEVPPTGNATLILRVSSSGCRLVLLGAASEKTTIERDGSADYYGLSFRPGQLPRLADVHPAELLDGSMELSRLGGERVALLAERLHELSGWDARRRLLESLVRGAPPLVRDPRCRQAAAVIDASAGQITVEALAAGLGLTVRSLERLLLAELGIGPKRLARLSRLQHLLARLRSGGFANLAELAAAGGYTDQPHMIRDFKALTGRLPGAAGAGDMQRIKGAPRTRTVHRCRP